ncbi:MAG: hypothetical protein BAJALOKI1v1_1850007 [Promethearchaeota archaeon]|nr:MAG: hypothetical protein BAJALOKI1v1_1850007 [Candidatus Lokiarchaeota archaeon]
MCYSISLELCLNLIEKPSFVLDSNYQLIAFNQQFFSTFRFANNLNRKISIFEINEHQWDFPAFKKLLLDILPRRKEVEEYKIVHDFKTLGIKNLNIHAKKIKSIHLQEELILLTLKEESSGIFKEEILKILEERGDIFRSIASFFFNYDLPLIFRKIQDFFIDRYHCESVVFGYNGNDEKLIIPLEKGELKYEKTYLKSIIENRSFKIIKLLSGEPFDSPSGIISIKKMLMIPITYGQEEIGAIFLINDLDSIDEIEINLLQVLSIFIGSFLFNLLQQKRINPFKERYDSPEIKSIDDVDKQILRELYNDGAQTLQDLSQKIIKQDGSTMSTTGIKKRISKLIKAKSLKIQGNINLQKFSYKMAFFFLTLKDFSKREIFLNQINSLCPKILMSGTLMGTHQVFISILGQSWEEINYCFHNCKVINSEEIKATSIFYVLDLKYPPYLPLKTLFEDCRQEPIK